VKDKLTRILILLLIIIHGLMINSYAIVSSTDQSTISGGEVTITLKSSETIYAYKVSIADEGGLTFINATSAEGQVNGKIINGAKAKGFNDIGTYKFKTPEVTEDTTYIVKFNVLISKDGETYENVVNSSKVTVKAKDIISESYTTGDVNEDGKINQKDAKLVLKAFAGKIELTENQTLSADVNGDNKINQKDAKLILKYFAGKITKF